MLLGYPSSISRQHSPYKPELHSNEPSFYVQDDWRTNDWLTLNIGLRYDVFTPFNDENGRLSNLDWTIPQPVVMVANENGVSETANVTTDYSNVAPRFGFAATLPRSIVLRGGWGLTYFPGNIASGYYMKNPPLFDSYAPTSRGDTSGGGAPDLLPEGRAPGVQLRPAARRLSLEAVGKFPAGVGRLQVEPRTAVQHPGREGIRTVTSSRPGTSDRAATVSRPAPTSTWRRSVQGKCSRAGRSPACCRSVNSIAAGGNDNKNTYDGFQVIVQRRFSGGLSLNAHARWSNAETYTTTGWDTNQFEWQLGGQDIGHAYVFQANYSLPFGESMTGFKGGLVRGWQVNAVANWQGGTPVNIGNQTEQANTGGSDRPNVVPGQDPVLPKDERTVDKYFNTSAWVTQPQFTLGNAPRTFMHGPPQRRLDLAVFKQIGLGGSQSLQLRYEVYNITNTANFQNPNASLGNNAFGTNLVDGQRHSASDAVRSEVPVLVRVRVEKSRPGLHGPGDFSRDRLIC